MRLRRITSGSICFREFRATLTIWNCFKLGCRASVQQRKQNSIIISWYYSKKKIRLAENRKPRKEQWHWKRCVINRTCKSHEMHVAYKVRKTTALTSNIFTSSKREIDRVALQTLPLRSQIGLWFKYHFLHRIISSRSCSSQDCHKVADSMDMSATFAVMNTT